MTKKKTAKKSAEKPAEKQQYPDTPWGHKQAEKAKQKTE
jgi:hypothetical protein